MASMRPVRLGGSPVATSWGQPWERQHPFSPGSNGALKNNNSDILGRLGASRRWIRFIAVGLALLVASLILLSWSDPVEWAESTAPASLSWGRHKTLPSLLAASDSPLLPIASYDQMAAANQACRTDWIRDGILCPAFKGDDSMASVDTVWAWQNVSDVAYVEATRVNPQVGPARDEWLRYSIRSAQRHLKKGFGSLRIILPDYVSKGTAPIANPPPQGRSVVRWSKPRRGSSSVPPASSAEPQSSIILPDELGRTRVGQVPIWLNTASPLVASATQEGALGPVSLEHHWNVACGGKPKAMDQQLNAQGSENGRPSFEKLTLMACKDSMLPTADPSTITRIALASPGSSGALVLMRDHHIFGGDVSSADFASVLYGPVLRFSELELGNNMTSTVMPEQQYANALISRRFGQRSRKDLLPYPAPVMRSIAHETERVWSKEWKSPEVKFDSLLLTTHYHVERHREALLWSFFVAKHDLNGDGFYSKLEFSSLLKDLGIKLEDGAQKEAVKVLLPERLSLAKDSYSRNLHQSALPPPQATNISFISQDGYFASGFSAWIPPDSTSISREGAASVPSFDSELWSARNASIVGKQACPLVPVCFEPFIDPKNKAPVPVNAVFARIAFQHAGCGDCVITLMVRKSGARGLKAFLPEEHLRMPSSPQAPPAHAQVLPCLPLSPTFEQVDFGLAAVAGQTKTGGMSRLSFATRLIQRYQYSIAGGFGLVSLTPIRDSTSPKEFLTELELARPAIFSLLDQTVKSAVTASDVLLAWLSLIYPDLLPFERA